MPRILKSKLSFDEIRHLYVSEEMTLREIASIANIHYLTVRKKLLRIGVKPRPKKEITEKTRERFRLLSTGRKRITPLTDQQKKNIRNGILNSSWSKNAKGLTIRNGYIAITKGKNRYRHIHRLIMEKHLGRKLKKGEVVHHIDGNRKNNELHNLQLMSHSEHSRLHALEMHRNKKERLLNRG